MTNQDLIKQCFVALNAFKRHRALGLIRRQENNMPDAQFHELKQYQQFDNLELALRALQTNLYDNKGESESVQEK